MCEIIIIIILILLNVLLSGKLMSIVLCSSLIGMCLFNHFVPMNFSDRILYELSSNESLRFGSFYGIGAILFRPYCSFGDINIRYAFFTILYFPIFPIGCYAVDSAETEFTFYGTKGEYTFNGLLSWNAIEVFNIYLRIASVIAFIVLLIDISTL